MNNKNTFNIFFYIFQFIYFCFINKMLIQHLEQTCKIIQNWKKLLNDIKITLLTNNLFVFNKNKLLLSILI